MTARNPTPEDSVQRQPGRGAGEREGGVQSLNRALGLLNTLADNDEIAFCVLKLGNSREVGPALETERRE